MIEVTKQRRVVNPGRRKRRMSMADKLAFVRRMKRARARKGNISIRKSKKAAKKKWGYKKVSMITKGNLKGWYKPKTNSSRRRRRVKRNVSSIVTVYPKRNSGRRRKYKRNRSKKIVIVNKGAKMATKRRRVRRSSKRVVRRRRRHNVVYRRRIKRGMYAYSSNPGRRRRRRHYSVNPRRRRRHTNVRRRRSYGRNPGMLGGTAGRVLGVVGGVAVTKLLCGFLPASLNTGILGYISTAAIAVLQGKLVGKFSKSSTLGNDMMVGGLAYLTAKILNDFFPAIGSYTGISGMGLIGGSSFYNPQVNMNGSMGTFVLPSAVSGAVMAAAPANAGVRGLRRTGRLM